MFCLPRVFICIRCPTVSPISQTPNYSAVPGACWRGCLITQAGRKTLEPLANNSGMFQSAILSTHPFFKYMNNLLASSSCHPFMYVDFIPSQLGDF